MMFSVPPTFTFITVWLKSGFTVTTLAQWMTMVSVPSSTAKKRARDSMSVRSPSQISAASGTNFIAGSFFSTKARTASPRSISWRQMVPPRKPAAPVTRYLMLFFFLFVILIIPFHWSSAQRRVLLISERAAGRCACRRTSVFADDQLQLMGSL